VEQLANLTRRRKEEMEKGQQRARAWVQFIEHYAEKLKDRPGNIFERCHAVIIEAGHDTAVGNSCLHCCDNGDQSENNQYVL
jgi:hypothetical protein